MVRAKERTKSLPAWEDTPKTDSIEFPEDNVDNYDLKEQRITRYQQNTRYRSLFAKWVLWIVPIWIGIILIMLLCQGLKWIALDDGVIITLLATTTANILGLAYIVLKGMFPEANGKNK